MQAVAIVGGGPVDHIPDLKEYEDEIDLWIGADGGALKLAESGITIGYAVGDFDSIDETQNAMIKDKTTNFDEHPVEKDATDLEIALHKAFDMNPERIYLFGVTGGRLDHALINMQLLHTIVQRNIRGIIVDKWNQLELTKPGTYTVSKSDH